VEIRKDKKVGFIRTLWGVPEKVRGEFFQRTKVDTDVNYLLKLPNQIPFVSYTFGEDNHKYLLDKGINSVLIDKRPYVFDMKTEQYRHKLEVFKLGMEEFGEMVFLDWDTVPTSKIPDNFWEEQRKRKPFQSVLRGYRWVKCPWRKNQDLHRMCPCASYVYFRDKQIPIDMIKQWETLDFKLYEEAAMAKYVDSIEGEPTNVHGFKKFWWDNYEAMYFNLFIRSARARVFSVQENNVKPACFTHVRLWSFIDKVLPDNYSEIPINNYLG